VSAADPLYDPGEVVRVSPSKVEEFHRCELRWLLKSCGATDVDISRAGVGSLIHDLAEDAGRNDWSADELSHEFERRWPQLDFGGGWVERREYRRARAMVDRLGRWLDGRRDRLVGTEVPFDVVVGTAHLVGRVDRLEVDDAGRLVVIDFKTSRSKVRDEDVATHPQLAAYQVAVESGGFDEASGGERRSGGAKLVQLQAHQRGAAREQEQLPLAEAADPTWAATLLATTAEAMSGADFAAQPSTWCGFCPARPSCPAHPEGAQVVP
jgi:RecB family exonuclease